MFRAPAYLPFAHELADRRRYLRAEVASSGSDASDSGSSDSADADRENSICHHMDRTGFYHAAAITTHKNVLKGPRVW